VKQECPPGLSEAQITAILEGKWFIAPPREVQEVENALTAYDRFENWQLETGHPTGTLKVECPRFQHKL
ncbi:MAG: hypothetical protein ACSLFC_03685, partial [Desulfuromonadales bacterium]